MTPFIPDALLLAAGLRTHEIERSHAGKFYRWRKPSDFQGHRRLSGMRVCACVGCAHQLTNAPLQAQGVKDET